ncbi:retrotransposon-related protein [Tanacetum coccineum]
MDEQAIRLLLNEQTDVFHPQIAALAADLQAAKLIQSHHGGGDQGSLLPRSMRFEVPKFNRTEPESWIFTIQEYFDLLQTIEDQRLNVVGFNLVGSTVEWFRWMSRNKLITNWEGFLESVRNRFGLCKYEDLQGSLFKLLQTGTVVQYQSEFEKLMNRVTDISENLLISFYMSGLKLTLQRELLVSKPTSLGGPVIATSSNSGKPPLLPTPTESTTPTNTTPLAIKWISPEERQECLNKGLCFSCDSKLISGHKCPGKFLLHMAEEDDNQGREIPVDSTYYLEDKVNFEGERNVMTEDKGEDEPRGSRLPWLGIRIS